MDNKFLARVRLLGGLPAKPRNLDPPVHDTYRSKNTKRGMPKKNSGQKTHMPKPLTVVSTWY